MSGMLGKKHSPETRMKMSLASKGKSKSKEHIEKMRGTLIKRYENGFVSPFEKLWKENPNFLRGENNPKWVKDRTKLVGRHDRRFHDPEYKNWSRSVKNRDGWKCKISDDNCSGRIEVHHILSWKDYPELRYQLNNGIALCHFHHPRRREDEKRLASFFKGLVSVSKE